MRSARLWLALVAEPRPVRGRAACWPSGGPSRMAQGVTYLLESSSRCRSFALAGELSRGKPALPPAERVLRLGEPRPRPHHAVAKSFRPLPRPQHPQRDRAEAVELGAIRAEALRRETGFHDVPSASIASARRQLTRTTSSRTTSPDREVDDGRQALEGDSENRD
jgi:hypothetical protein